MSAKMAHQVVVQLRDRDTGKPILAHSGSVYWNDYRKRWALIAVQSGGAASFLIGNFGTLTAIDEYDDRYEVVQDPCGSCGRQASTDTTCPR